ncbi:MAG: hypothetical protein EBT20_04630 [Alphaproteobacteria bacterium]|nr:hypothetical protein [Alphaproteobacteria bacterium]
MLIDDFFLRALIGGIGVALMAGPLGCFIVWKRLAYFGDTLAHAALLGVTLGFLWDINVVLAVFAGSVLLSFSMLALQRTSLPSDTLLGLLSHSTLAIGLVALGFMTWIRVDLMGLLFGDILSIAMMDILVIWGGNLIVLIVLFYIWRGLFVATVSKDIAIAEGMRPEQTNAIFMLLMALVIAVSIKIVGVLLITALLIIPAAAARPFARSPEQMAMIASLIGVMSVIFGLLASFNLDTPSGPSIVVVALIMFCVGFFQTILRSAR